MRIQYLMTVLAVCAVPASALNMSGFRDAPLTRLTPDEVSQFRAVVMKTLDTAPDGATVEWKAPKTPFVTRITPQKSFSEGKRKCRDVTIASEAKDRMEQGSYQLCKTGNGEWGFAKPPAKKAAAK